MKAMMTRFQTIDTTAGMVKRSNEYSTPITTPETLNSSTVGSRMRSISTARWLT